MRPALAAEVPENVLGLSPFALALDPLVEREPTMAAPALAGLCLGFIPAARPPDGAGGRPLPSSVDVDAAEPGRSLSVAFLVSGLICVVDVALVDPIGALDSALALEDDSVLMLGVGTVLGSAS